MNKKDIIIIGSYSNTPEKVDMLNECIERVKPLGYDIMLVSHYPVPFEIQEKVDYFIYDKENLKQSGESTPEFYFHSSEFSLLTYYNSDSEGGHALAVVKNINNGINFAAYLNYKFFFYLECDNLLSEKDLVKIQILKNSMVFKKKNLIIFNYLFGGFPIYETLMFGGEPTYFLENIFLPKTDEEFLGERMSLEDFFYYSHNKLEESFYVVPTSTSEYFSSSKINKLVGHVSGSVFGNYFIGVFGSNHYPNLHFFIRNSNTESIQFKINDGEFTEIGCDGWHMRKVSPGSKLVVTVVSEGVSHSREYDLDENKILEYYKKGFIHFN